MNPLEAIAKKLNEVAGDVDALRRQSPGTGYLRTPVSGTPASAAAAGVKGETKYDSNYMYICVATDTWIRVARTAW